MDSGRQQDQESQALVMQGLGCGIRYAVVGVNVAFLGQAVQGGLLGRCQVVHRTLPSRAPSREYGRGRDLHFADGAGGAFTQW